MPDPINPNPTNDGNESIEEFRKTHKAPDNSHIHAGRVHARLRDAILSAELRPNSRLVEGELADWLKVSRTPIREALFLLEQEGLVDRSHGWVVREHDLSEIRDRLESRLAIEGFAARLAAGRRSEADLEELKKLADEMEKTGVLHTEFIHLKDRFHKVIMEAARNPTLENLHTQTKVNYWNLNVPVIFPTEEMQLVHEQHRALIEALQAGDGDKAEMIMRSHIQLTSNIIFDALGLKE